MRVEDCVPGQVVVYRPNSCIPEQGMVVRVSEGGLVFVLYRGDVVAKATSAQDLELRSNSSERG